MRPITTPILSQKQVNRLMALDRLPFDVDETMRKMDQGQLTDDTLIPLFKRTEHGKLFLGNATWASIRMGIIEDLRFRDMVDSMLDAIP